MRNNEEKEILTYTVVLHQARKKLRLTLNEYCFVDTVYHLQNNPNSKVKGWCYASKAILGDYIGISEQSAHSIANKTIKMGLIEKDPDTRYLRATQLWYENVVLLRLHSRNLRDTKESLAIHSRKLSQTLKKVEPKAKESLVNSNRDKNKDRNKIKILKYKTESLKLAKLLYELIKEQNPAWHVKPNWDRWAKDMDDINRIDKYTFEQIEFMIRWCQKDSFWRANILSPAKLRKQFSNLIPKIKAQAERKGKNIIW